MFLIFLLFPGLFLNMSLVLLFLTRKKMATPYHLLYNLAVSNCIACLFLLPQLIINLLTSERNIVGGRSWPCEWLETVADAWWIPQNLTIMFISYERYNFVANPFNQNISPSKVFYNIATIWCATLAVMALLFTPWVSASYYPAYKSCRKEWEHSLAYSIFYTSVTFCMPAVALFYSYIYMLRECYLKKKIINVVSSQIIHADRTIYPDQYAATIGRSLTLKDVISPGTARAVKETPIINRSNSVSYARTMIPPPSRDISSAWSGTSSRTGSSHDISNIRKRSLQTKSMRKSVHTTLLIFGSYLFATLPDLIRICFHMTGKAVSVNLEAATITRYTLIFSFPYIFGPHSKIIKHELRRMYHRARCWRSGRIKPSLNIDEKDYTDNVVRRDSRRESLATSRKNSLSKHVDEIPLPKIPPVIHFNRTKEGTIVTTIQQQHQQQQKNDIIIPTILFVKNEIPDRRTLPPVG